MSGLFVTGTDTGCGKTSVACVLARALRARGRKVAVLKPIETGCEIEEGERIASDASALAAAADDARAAEEICPYRFLMPAAPNVAARDEGATIELERLERAYRSAAESAEVVIVEGAGGALVPILDSFDMLDLARLLGLPLLVVARAALGTINHTRLTLEAAQSRGLSVLGVVISHTTPELSRADRANLNALLERLGPLCLGELDHAALELRPHDGFGGLLAQLSPGV